MQLIPQVWKSWRSKSTEGLSEYLVLLWGISGTFFGVYVLVQNLNIPLIVQPQLLSALSYFSWAQCLYYGRKWSRLTSALAYVAVVFVSGGFEAGMVFVVKPAYERGNERPSQFLGVFSTILLSVALLPQYYEIYKHKEVIGISILFMLVDTAGGVFSDLSLAFKESFDVVAGITYSLVVILDSVIIICAIILNPRAARRRKLQAAAEASSSDEERGVIGEPVQPAIDTHDQPLPTQAERSLHEKPNMTRDADVPRRNGPVTERDTVEKSFEC